MPSLRLAEIQQREYLPKIARSSPLKRLLHSPRRTLPSRDEPSDPPDSSIEVGSSSSLSAYARGSKTASLVLRQYCKAIIRRRPLARASERTSKLGTAVPPVNWVDDGSLLTSALSPVLIQPTAKSMVKELAFFISVQAPFSISYHCLLSYVTPP